MWAPRCFRLLRGRGGGGDRDDVRVGQVSFGEGDTVS